MEKEKMSFFDYIKERSTHKPFLAIILAYATFCLVSGVYFSIAGQTKGWVTSFAYLGFILAIYLGEYLVNLRCGTAFLGGLLFLAGGAILGSCYNFYILVPFFDLLLHTLSGVLFACLGFSLAQLFFGEKTGTKAFFGKLLFGVCFSLTVAVAWELFEYTCSALFGLDMLEDGIIRGFNSYLLSGTHSETVQINDIVKTIVYYGDGLTYVIDGYLDIGLIDTIGDMAVCTLGAVAFALLDGLSYFYCPRLHGALILKVEGKERR